MSADDPTTPSPRVPRLRAVTRRVPRRLANHPDAGSDDTGDDGSALPEPIAKLPRAVGVMLLFHMVAIGGFLAFGLIKERPTSSSSGSNRPVAKSTGASQHPPTTEDSLVSPPQLTLPSSPSTPSPSFASPARAHDTPALSRVEADAVKLIENGGPNPVNAGERAYLVSQGETLQSIARKFRVEPGALLRLNGLDDPRKVQAGQRLRVPPPTQRPRS